MSRRTAPAFAVVLIVALASDFGAGSASAQDRPPSVLPFLLDVGDMRALVRYSPGALDRASHVQARLAVLAEDFARWSGEPVALNAVLLSRTDWASLDLAVPYGLPAKLATGEIALAGFGDDRTVSMWRGVIGQALPRLDGFPLHGTLEEAGSLLLTDLLTQSVASRVLLERGGFAAVDSRALSLATHVVALAVCHRHDVLSLPELRKIYYGPATAASSSEWADWRAPLEAESRFFRAAEAILARRGAARAPKALLKEVRRLQRRGEPTLEALARKFPELRPFLS